MSNDLVSTGGGLPAMSSGGQLAEYFGSGGGGQVVTTGDMVGDVSRDRGQPSVGRDAGAASAITRFADGAAAKMGLSEQQVAAWRSWVTEHGKALKEEQDLAIIDAHLAQDALDKKACESKLRASWGKHYEAHLLVIKDWLATFPEALSEAIMNARRVDGSAILNEPAVVQALLEAARGMGSAAQDELDRQHTEKTLRGEWGGSYKYNLQAIKRFLAGAPPAFAFGVENGRNRDGTAICNDPAVIRFLARISGRGGSGNATPVVDVAARQREIESWLQKSDPRYWNDKAVQDEYYEILQGKAPTGGGSNADRRIAEIEKMMRDRPREYQRDEDVQRELRELYEQRARSK